MAIDNNGLSSLDMQQVVRSSVTELSSGQLATKVAMLGGNLVPKEYDELDLTYVASGNGAGEVETVTYKYAGNTVAMLTLTYDASNRVINVLRS